MWIAFQLLSVASWAWVNVLDSLLVRHYEKKPYVLMWYQSLFSVPLLLFLLFTTEFPGELAWPLLIGGVLSYFGDIVFFYVLDRIDVSVANITWAILSLFLSLIGIFFLGEIWNASDMWGVLLVFLGIGLLSLWHRKIGKPAHLLLLPLLAALYVPYYVSQEVALLHGSDLVSVFFWPLLARELSALTIGLTVPKVRRAVLSIPSRKRIGFHAFNAAVITFFLLGTFLTVKAFTVGPLSLVSVVSNVQPFFVLAFAGLLHIFFPRFAAKEVLTLQSLGVKIVSFAAVFSGLALLTLSSS